MELPSGVVTFVFTDIEGSTRILRRVGDRYPDLLERCRSVQRGAWVAHGGCVISTDGDAMFVAFADANDALRACAAAQVALRDEDWPDDARIAVRMGVHAGPATPRNDDYMALAVHQAARVVTAAHGGQVVLTSEVAARARSNGGPNLLDLGHYTLRDFDAPVRLFQLPIEGAPSTFPPVRALPADHHNLLLPTSPFIGRDRDVRVVDELIAPGRCVTLTGPGGVGKTRLAIQVGLGTVPRWPDGVWMIELATIEDADLVVRAVADTIGASGGDDTEGFDLLLGHLQGRHALLILDNCEHLVPHIAAFVERLASSCPSVGVLATSRERLHAATERVHAVQPLALPADASSSAALDSPAVRLFVERARAARPDFELDATNQATVVGICRRLDGLPLALEIASAHLSALSAADILKGLEADSGMLHTRDRRRPNRQRSLEAVLEWSEHLLGDQERATWRRLSVFGSTFDVDAALAAACDGDLDADDARECLWSLVDNSLVIADLTESESRYRLLESVRAFGRARLAQHDEEAAVAARLARWYLARVGLDQSADHRWVSTMAAEIDNVRALIPFVARDDQSTAQALACTIGRYLDAAGRSRDGVDELLRWVHELTGETAARVGLLTQLAVTMFRTRDPRAEGPVHEAAMLEQRVGSPPWDEVAVVRALGEAALQAGRHAEAADIAREGLASASGPRGRARLYNLLGLASVFAGDLVTAADAFDKELEIYIALSAHTQMASSHGNLAELALRRGDIASAATHQRAALRLALELGHQVMIAFSLLVAARIARWLDEFDASVQLSAFGEQMLDAVGHRLYEDDRRVIDEMVEECGTRLGADRLEAARRDGRALELAAAVAMAGAMFDKVG